MPKLVQQDSDILHSFPSKRSYLDKRKENPTHTLREVEHHY